MWTSLTSPSGVVTTRARQDAFQARQQVLRPAHAPGIRRAVRSGSARGRPGPTEIGGCRGTESGHVRVVLVCPAMRRAVRSGRTAHATAFRPAALARYSARSALTSRSPSDGSRGSNSASPMLTVTSPGG